MALVCSSTSARNQNALVPEGGLEEHLSCRSRIEREEQALGLVEGAQQRPVRWQGNRASLRVWQTRHFAYAVAGFKALARGLRIPHELLSMHAQPEAFRALQIGQQS